MLLGFSFQSSCRYGAASIWFSFASGAPAVSLFVDASASGADAWHAANERANAILFDDD
jgi:hypothetical protein